ncbi:MAG: hypothetical protein IKS07_06500 [Lachnospiraceae bacterium]|nr:hypothetical protein [Lachnospiraceae bacterium]
MEPGKIENRGKSGKDPGKRPPENDVFTTSKMVWTTFWTTFFGKNWEKLGKNETNWKMLR